MQARRLPNFFIAGTGKAGTTSLYHYLRQHPQIYMSPIKEPSYFASEVCPENLEESYLRHVRRMSRKLPKSLGDGGTSKPLGWLVKDWNDYLRLFQDVRSETAIGEASVVYLWSRTAAEHIASAVPDAKVIIILRDPAERAFSQYFHQLTVGLVRSAFREHVEHCLKTRLEKITACHPFLEVGLYHEQVQRYLERFPRNNIGIYWYEEAWKEPRAFLRDLFEFLEVDPTFCPDMSQRSLQRRAPRFAALNYLTKKSEAMHRLNEVIPPALKKPIRKFLFRHGSDLKLDPTDRRFLVDYYRDDILKLASLLGRDLSSWLAA